MASWAIHFRIADAFLPRFSENEKDSFVIGNIAPDCGKPTEGGYNPPTEVTHRAYAGNKTDCDWQYFCAMVFWRKRTDRNRLSFWDIACT